MCFCQALYFSGLNLPFGNGQGSALGGVFPSPAGSEARASNFLTISCPICATAYLFELGPLPARLVTKRCRCNHLQRPACQLVVSPGSADDFHLFYRSVAEMVRQNEAIAGCEQLFVPIIYAVLLGGFNLHTCGGK